MFLPHFSIRRPVAATVMVGALVVFGAIGLSRLGVSLYPDVDYPIVTVSTVWPNARPEEVDNEVTDRLEDAVIGVSGIRHISSQSLPGRSVITVEFQLEKDVDVAAQEVRDKVAARVRLLPEDAEAPVVDKLDVNAQPIMWLALTGQQPVEELTRFADDQVRPLLQRFEGVGEVRIGGAREKEVRIWLDRERLAAHDVSVGEVAGAVRAQHAEVPGGKIETREREYLIRTVGTLAAPEAFNDLILARRSGRAVRLRDVGYAEAGREESLSVARFTDRDGSRTTVSLGVAPRSGANQVAIARSVNALLPEIRAILLEGMQIRVAADNTRFIEESIDEIRSQLLLGGAAAVLTILLFLQSFRTTLISAVPVPTAIVATFAGMHLFGYTLNNMTMLALITGIGLMIDDAIVTVENIHRHRTSLGKGPMRAALDGSGEVYFAVMATNVAMAGVFLPVAFMGGLIGRFFLEFAVTMTFAILASTFVGLTVVPMLASRLLKAEAAGSSAVFRFFNRIEAVSVTGYRRLIGWSLRRRPLVVAVALAALAGGGVLFQALGKELVAAEDQGRFFVRLRLPLSYSLQKTEEVLRRVEERLQAIPEVSHFFSFAGAGGAQNAFVFVTMHPKGERERDQQQVQREVNAHLRSIPDLRGVAAEFSPLGAGGRSEDVQLVIMGPELGGLDRYSRQIMERLDAMPGYVGVTRDLDVAKPEVRVRIDRDRAADAGVSVRDVADAVSALMGGQDIGDYVEGGRTHDIRVRLIPQHRELPEDVGRVWVRSSDGRLVDASGFVTLEVGGGPSVVNRTDRRRSATVYAKLDGKVLGAALPEVRALAEQALPAGYAIRFAGRAETFGEAGRHAAFAFVLAVVLTYLVLAFQFESFAQPLAIMTGLPLAFVGAFGLLLLFGNTVNVFSLMGLILLVGIATKNGILLVDFTNQIRARGFRVNEALVEAGATRLRPILMTAVSTIAGVVPVVIGIGVGSESRQPLAVAITGGILSSTVLTLVVVPVAYSYLEQLGRLRAFRWVRERVIVPDSEKPPEPPGGQGSPGS